MEPPSYSFPEPKRKRLHKSWTPSAGESPFPIPIASILGLPASDGRWNYFTGRLAGTSVYIDDQTSASLLYQMVSTANCVVLLVRLIVVSWIE